MSEVAERFYQAIENILKLRIDEFMKRYSDLLPGFALIDEDEEVNRVLDLLRKGKHYIIVVDSKRRMKGIISYIDFMLMFGRRRTTALSAPFSSVGRSLRRSRMPLETFVNLSASDIMSRLPPHVWLDSQIEEALKYMSSTGSNYAVVTARDGTVMGIITAHAIFRAVLRKAGFEQVVH